MTTLAVKTQKYLKETVDQAFENRPQIEMIASQYGYILHGNFLPHEFQNLCSIMTQQMLKIIQEKINPAVPEHQNILSDIQTETQQLVHEKLKQICRITPPIQIRNPPPVLGRWILSWWQ